MKPLADFLTVEQRKKRAGSERSDLIRYFHERARDRRNKPFRAGYIAFRLSHLSIADLYAFRSMLEDRSRTKDGFHWNKTFFGMLKPREDGTTPF